MATSVIQPGDVPTLPTVLKDPRYLETPTCTITSKKDESHPMRAVEFHGKIDVKVKIRPRPIFTDPATVLLLRLALHAANAPLASCRISLAAISSLEMEKLYNDSCVHVVLRLVEYGMEIINSKEKSTLKELRNLFPHGLDVDIEAVGVHYVANVLHKLEVLMGLETDSTEVINEVIYGVRKGRRIGLIGAYAGFANHFNLGAFIEKGLSMSAGQTPVQKYWPTLFPLVQSGELDPAIVITHVLGLGDAPDAYARFNAKEQEWIKVLLKPETDPDVITTDGPSLKERARNLVSGAVSGTIDAVQKATAAVSSPESDVKSTDDKKA